MTFRILLVVDGLAAAIVLYFFAVGVADGSVSAFNGELWAGILLALAAVLAGGVLLHRAGRPRLGSAVLALLAAPALLYGLFIALVIFSGARWN